MADLTDERDITDLLFAYAECVDTRRFDRLDEIFTEDATVDLGYGAWRLIGPIVEGYRGLLADVAGTAHAVSNVRVSLEGKTGRSTAYVHAWHWIARNGEVTAEQSAEFLFIALYIDDLVKIDGIGWRISRRRARRVGPTALAAGRVPEFMVPSQG